MIGCTPDAQVVTWISQKYTAIEADVDERARRRWAAAEAISLGWGGTAAVAKATGISDVRCSSDSLMVDAIEIQTIPKGQASSGHCRQWWKQ